MVATRHHLLSVFTTKLIFNLKSEASKTYLSYLWWLLEPALLVIVLYWVFSSFLRRGTDNFFVFLLCGKIPFLWFSRSITNSAGSILAGKGLISQVAIPKPFFPMLVVCQDFVKQTVVFACLISGLILYGQEYSWVWFSLVFIVGTQFLMISGFSLFVAAITPFLPDFRYLIATAMMMLLFASGVFYSYVQVLSPQHQRYFLLNPLANLLNNYRRVLMYNQLPDWTALGIISLCSILLIILMTLFYRRTDTLYARLVVQ
ncbi:MAG: ABC transporter permease [Pseudomonadota bacterium]